MSEALPIEAVRDQVMSALGQGRVVVSAPTGSGKSTQIPRWCAELGSVLVVEPRRVAALSLAARVSSLEGEPVGQTVGYAVRGDAQRGEETRVLFVTTGVAVRLAAAGELAQWDTLVLDEYHERSLDLDLLLALALKQGVGRLVVMSATLEGDRVAAHLGGTHVSGEGRLFPVEVRYAGGGADLPEERGLEGRVLRAVREARALPGDILVFVPGKGELQRVSDALSGEAGLEVVALHGGQSLAEQGRAFKPGQRRRVVVATNVAETSVTLPRIGVVIDGGLVRRTRYHHGRGYLVLAPVAQDSAEQRAGRAGRLGPGVAFRLWGERAELDPVTPPEVHRESLVPLVLGAAACGEHALDLPFFDPLKDYAVEDARRDLRDLEALDGDGRITPRGRTLFGLPLDPHLGRLLIEAELQGTLEDAVDLAAAVAAGRPLFVGPRPREEADDLRREGCDATGLIRAVRRGEPGRHGLAAYPLREARALARRLREAWGLVPSGEGEVDRHALALTVMGAWPWAAHVARRRKRQVAWSHGGTEVRLARESAVPEDEAEAILAVDSRALGKGRRALEVILTAAMPVPLPWLVEGGRGRDQLARVDLVRGQIVSRVDRVYAGKVIQSREETPQGALAREAVAALVVRGRLFKGALPELEERLERASLWRRLQREEGVAEVSPEDWIVARLTALGLEAVEDLPLLSAEDLLPAALDPWDQEELDRKFPRTLALGDATYRFHYEPGPRVAVMTLVSGARRELPPVQFLPSLPGWRVELRENSRVRVVRERR
ncbi:MAG: ATP-dependent RNA helicase [Deltaproteobacteria bacterium]|nr:ATP-dependent RNA helicase [Deltaproteobacteria bacterium]